MVPARYTLTTLNLVIGRSVVQKAQLETENINEEQEIEDNELESVTEHWTGPGGKISAPNLLTQRRLLKITKPSPAPKK